MPLKVSDAKRLLTGPFFSPPDPPAPQRLSKTRKEMILQFKARPGIHKNKGSEEWEQKLFRFLNRRDAKIQPWDVRKWVKAHDWITDRVPVQAIQEAEENEEQVEEAIPVDLNQEETLAVKNEIEEAAGPAPRAVKAIKKLRRLAFVIKEEGEGENREEDRTPKTNTRSGLRERSRPSNRDGDKTRSL